MILNYRVFLGTWFSKNEILKFQVIFYHYINVKFFFIGKQQDKIKIRHEKKHLIKKM